MLRHPVSLRVRTSDLSLYNEILVSKEYSFSIVDLCANTIVDAGANIGLSSIYFATQYPNAAIVALEPEASNFSLLCKNVAPYSNIIAINAALWNTDGQVHLANPESPRSRWAFRVQNDGGIVARAITMQTLMLEAGLLGIDLLKIDIEGAEVEVFQDLSWLDRVSRIVIELHERLRPGSRQALIAATKGWNRLEKGELTLVWRGSQ